MNETDSGILERLGARYEPVDANGSIQPRDPRFWSLAGTSMPDGPVGMEEAFEETFGAGDDIRAVLASGRGEYRLAGFKRGDRYLDLIVVPAGSGGRTDRRPDTRGFVVLRDGTAEMLSKLAVVQSKNETAILHEALAARNVELQAANARLDELMRTIRDRNHDLDLNVKRRTAELIRSRLSVIAILARVAEFRDADTSRHTYHIGRSSHLIGERQGLSDDECRKLFHASLLHDIGKIGIPDAILLKPGRLDRDEMAVMREHTRIGAEILDHRDDPLFDLAKDIALYHHERWDGGGYPLGLSGERIPLVGRICAVVDVFDALISKRPYKDAWPLDRALAEIKAQSGTQFDPSVVESFLAVADDIAALHAEDDTPELLSPDIEALY